jgi:hypothetical protein
MKTPSAWSMPKRATQEKIQKENYMNRNQIPKRSGKSWPNLDGWKAYIWALTLCLSPVTLGVNAATAQNIVHDAEYYILEAQNGKVWAVEDGELDNKLAALKEKYGAPPNIIHYMFDDQPVMSFGDPI